MLSANQRLVFARELENSATAPEALKLILADEDFDKPINDLEFTEADYFRISSALTTQGPSFVVKEVERIQAVQQEVARVQEVTQAWLSSHPEFVCSEENKNALRQFMEKFMEREKLTWTQGWTKGNLEKAWRELMLAGKLEEAPVQPSRPYFVGQRDPSREIDGDSMPRKSVAKMSAQEFATAITNSKKFRDKVNEGPATASSSGPTEAELAFRAENLKKQADKRELKRTIGQMPSKVYDEWVKIPENRAAVESLYAKAAG
jgi:hypothetical protein